MEGSRAWRISLWTCRATLQRVSLWMRFRRYRMRSSQSFRSEQSLRRTRLQRPNNRAKISRLRVPLTEFLNRFFVSSFGLLDELIVDDFTVRAALRIIRERFFK